MYALHENDAEMLKTMTIVYERDVDFLKNILICNNTHIMSNICS